MTNEDIKNLTERFDDRYVMQDNCETKHKAVNERQNSTEVRVAVTSSQLTTLIKVLACIGSAAVVALVAIAVKVIFGGGA